MSTPTVTGTDVLTALLERHRSDGRHDCGARTELVACSSRQGSNHVLHCTLEPGHGPDVPHKDALHCWSFETFDNDAVVGYQPRDLSRCVTCGTTWPCEEREFLDSLTGGA